MNSSWFFLVALLSSLFNFNYLFSQDVSLHSLEFQRTMRKFKPVTDILSFCIRGTLTKDGLKASDVHQKSIRDIRQIYNVDISIICHEETSSVQYSFKDKSIRRSITYEYSLDHLSNLINFKTPSISIHFSEYYKNYTEKQIHNHHYLNTEAGDVKTRFDIAEWEYRFCRALNQETKKRVNQFLESYRIEGDLLRLGPYSEYRDFEVDNGSNVGIALYNGVEEHSCKNYSGIGQIVETNRVKVGSRLLVSGDLRMLIFHDQSGNGITYQMANANDWKEDGYAYFELPDAPADACSTQLVKENNDFLRNYNSDLFDELESGYPFSELLTNPLESLFED
ncbi:hypothetical protein N9N67_08075 [Bacteriovoracaceae bacterium]|nr:hypothetical protein [Bacteriovoracaceae bacterium]